MLHICRAEVAKVEKLKKELQKAKQLEPVEMCCESQKDEPRLCNQMVSVIIYNKNKGVTRRKQKI